MLPQCMFADIAPSATYIDNSGTEVTTTENFEGEAPLRVLFRANASNLDAGATLEWHFRHIGADGQTNITRYEENTEYTFMESGETLVSLLVMQENEMVDSMSIRVTISESHLEMPNAFSPNGDDHNNTYKAKSNHKSIVEFHAIIFNRWGQKLYEWNDVDGEWDGTYKGSPVKDGVYFVLVRARGADGKVYNIRRDVNLLRNKNEYTENAGGQP